MFLYWYNSERQVFADAPRKSQSICLLFPAATIWPPSPPPLFCYRDSLTEVVSKSLTKLATQPEGKDIELDETVLS